MGFAAEKEKIEKRIAKYKRIVLACVLLIFISVCVFSAFVPPDTWKYAFGLPNIDKRTSGELRLHCIDVGQGDCTLIEFPDGKIMLIDGGNGERENTTALMRYLHKLNVDTIDYLVVTHADKDHCGGLAEVVKYKKVEHAFLPKCDLTENVAYATLYTQLTRKNVTWSYTARRVNLSVESVFPYTLRCIYPYTLDVEENQEYADDNLYSSVFWLDYQGVSILLMSDVPTSIENKLIADDALGAISGVSIKDTEILKVGHHGGADATGESLISYMSALKHAVVSCGAQNIYGHPSKEVCDRLRLANVAMHRTDLQGSIVISIQENGKYTIENLGK